MVYSDTNPSTNVVYSDTNLSTNVRCSRLTFHILRLQTFEIDPLPPLLSVFEMFISPELEYPMVCLGVRKGFVSFTFICLI